MTAQAANDSSTYDAFIRRVREMNTARSIESLLDWDQETQLPPRGTELRADQLSLIAGIVHERVVSPDLSKLLSELEKSGVGGDEGRTANLREVRRDVDRAVKLPTELVRSLAKATALAKDAWARARKESNFAKFAPHLQEIIDLKQEVARRVGYTTEPYDALMDEFEPGAKASEIQAVFDQLRPHLVELTKAIGSAPRKPDLSILERHCPKAAQAEFNRMISAAIGFEFEAGRIDISTHPFCSGLTPNDVRLTTRYDEKYMPMSLFGILHEAGHGMYEQGLPAEHYGTPLAQAVSLGIHESQSRMWENMVGRGRPFWQHFFPLIQKAMPSLADVSLDAWHFAINNVRPSLIRVEADEVTYGLHIMLRFDLERRMFRGEIAVKDVPAAWNDAMQRYLGISPPDDAHGCLQDIHWSLGIFGYFPTYQLGNMYAAQFFAAARRAIPDMDARLARGDCRPLLDWLRSNIHGHGRKYRAGDLVQRVTGSALSHEPYLAYLTGKYKPLYGLA